MTDDFNIRRLPLRDYRFDNRDDSRQIVIQTNAVGGVCVRIDAAPNGSRGGSFTVDFADVEPLCTALRAAALVASRRFVETLCSMQANHVIERARIA